MSRGENEPTGTLRLSAFRLDNFTHIRGFEVSGFGDAIPMKMTRWGTDGLAILASDGRIFLLDGDIVTSP